MCAQAEYQKECLQEGQWPLGPGGCFFLLESPGPNDRYGALLQTGFKLAMLKHQQTEERPGREVSLLLPQPWPFIYWPLPSSGAWADCSLPQPDRADIPNAAGRHEDDCGCPGLRVHEENQGDPIPKPVHLPICSQQEEVRVPGQ